MASNTIQLDGNAGDFVLCEANAAATVNPGNLVEITSVGTVQKHSVDSGDGICQVAVEDALQGNTIATAYTVGNKVIYHVMRPGTRFQGIVKAAVGGTAIAIGTQMISDGAGRFIAAADTGSTVKKVMAIAEEAADLNDSGDVDTLVAMRAC